MSRSYKKTPVLKYAPQGNVGQKFANRRVRRFKGEISNGKAYKKLYETWNVHDHVERYTLQDALDYRDRCIHDYENGISRWGFVPSHLTEEEKDRDLCIQKWKKTYIRK